MKLFIMFLQIFVSYNSGGLVKSDKYLKISYLNGLIAFKFINNDSETYSVTKYQQLS